MFNTFNKDFQEYNFNFDHNEIRFDFGDDLYSDNTNNKSLSDLLSMTEIKSTEELSQKNESSSLKNFAEDNEIVYKEEGPAVCESKSYDFDAIQSLEREVRAQINSNDFDKLIDEIIDVQAWIETDLKDNLVIQTKHK